MKITRDVISDLLPAYVRHLTRSVILCSLASRRVKPRRRARTGRRRSAPA